ncbi:MAG: LysE family translocator [Deltaproteobacteria bacterium]|nr:LysE family translocator [Deltaproteobacteria bacterium]
MMEAILAGFVLGLPAGLAPGPLLAFVLAQTIKHGPIEGIKSSLAPLVTDVPIIILSLVLMKHVARFGPLFGIVSLAGGLYLIYLAYDCARVPVQSEGLLAEYPRSLRKAVLINFLNPHPYLFWATVGAPLIIRFAGKSSAVAVLFLIFFYIGLVGSKVLLALVGGRYRTVLTGRGYRYILRVLSGALVLFAVFLLKEAWRYLGSGGTFL